MKLQIETLPAGEQLATLEIPFTPDERVVMSLRMPRDDMLLSALQAHMLRSTVRRLQGLLDALGEAPR